ncbi:MAG: thioredoxin domain-containing protein [Pseudomonadota bacterium]
MNAPPRRTLIAAALVAMAFAAGPAAGAAPVGDMSLGDPKAPVKMVEYASLSCIHCAAFNNEIFPHFKKTYIDTGKVHYTLREVLTEPANIAAAGFMTARCAGAENYFKVVDAAFRGFPDMMRTQNARANLVAAAKAGGLTEAQFVACVGDQAGLEAMQTRASENAEKGAIRSTPTFFFNGKKVAEAAMSLPELDAAVASAAKTAAK